MRNIHRFFPPSQIPPPCQKAGPILFQEQWYCVLKPKRIFVNQSCIDNFLLSLPWHYLMSAVKPYNFKPPSMMERLAWQCFLFHSFALTKFFNLMVLDFKLFLSFPLSRAAWYSVPLSWNKRFNQFKLESKYSLSKTGPRFGIHNSGQERLWVSAPLFRGCDG